jgi:hypothetical protein
MLDLTGIMFSSVMMWVVIVRAVRFDRVQPWFQTVAGMDNAAKGRPRTWRRRG